MFKALALPSIFSSLLPQTTAKQSGRRNISVVKPRQMVVAVSLVVLNVVVLVSYLVGFNSYAAKGYEIKQLQTKLGKMTEENKKLNIKASEMSSMLTVQGGSVNSGYVAAGTPYFLTVTAPYLTYK